MGYHEREQAPSPSGDAPASGPAPVQQDLYPKWIHAGLLSPSKPNGLPSPSAPPLPSTSYAPCHPHATTRWEDDEIKSLLVNHLAGHCSGWDKQLAWRWKILEVDVCNAYVGMLETFIEEREVTEDCKPYGGGEIEIKGLTPGCWEVDTRAEFPPLFTPSKTVSLNLPNSEVVRPCNECKGQGKVPCPTCTSFDESGNLLQKMLFTCSRCHGRGLIAHLEGSDTSCFVCKETGKVKCSGCHSSAFLKCEHCQGLGVFLAQSKVVIKWRTLLSQKVISPYHAAAVPDGFLQKVKGFNVVDVESQQCQPASFENSNMLTNLSQEVVRGKSYVPQAARIICERHRITMVPVTCVTMEGRDLRPFKFYIVGLEKDVHMQNYPCCSSSSESGSESFRFCSIM